MTQVETITDPKRNLKLLTNDSIVQNLRFVNYQLIEAHYIHDREFILPNGRTNAVISAFTTAHARLKFHEVLHSLEDSVLYYDTYSIIFISVPGLEEPVLGDYLEELTSETGNEHITKFVLGGTKNYAYQLSDGTTHCKV